MDLGGEFIDAKPAVHTQPDFGIQDILFLATKAHDLEGLLPTLSALIGPQTLVVPLVNGIPWWYFQAEGSPHDGEIVRAVDPSGILQRAIPVERLIGCVVYLTVRMLPGGEISALPGQRRLVIGALHPSQAERAAVLAGVLSSAGLPTVATSRIRDDLWTKVALNVATNPLSVVSEATLQEQFTDPRLLSSVSAVLEEALRVARAHGAQPLPLERMLAIGPSGRSLRNVDAAGLSGETGDWNSMPSGPA